ncbi:iron chelate uptake ABC transporter family permease subunit [Wenxinia saemankumensis]|uniref:Iron complex transport system permease protein n=1 Tax=Wenxinia saemankumensis TaxID=1447782 RepID=A0A1M6AC71_9RHOB|nr:iron chelate uptake ABC transporter family permease subunit [Wenxinia saemankumensis]SHI34055.1 iron complex transport system permease protein [Wenxinia saemankumensis]
MTAPRAHLALGLLALALLSGASVLVGAASLFGGDLDAGLLVAVSRVPRTLAALLAGAALAVAGAVVQLAVQNRLVEPGLVGTPEAATLGLLGITLMAPGAPLIVKMAVAGLAALAGTFGFLALARAVPRRDPVLLPLVGLIYGGILGAAALWLGWITDLVQYVGTWMSGEFSGVLRGRYELLWIGAAATAALYAAADRLTLLGLGEDTARALGLDARGTLLAGLALVSVCVAAVVVTVGSIPFVGLVVPNLVSRWRGDNLRRNLPLIAMGGAGAVLACDILGRVIRWPYEIPAGTIFAVLGAGLFLWLLHAAPRGGHHG